MSNFIVQHPYWLLHLLGSIILIAVALSSVQAWAMDKEQSPNTGAVSIATLLVFVSLWWGPVAAFKSEWNNQAGPASVPDSLLNSLSSGPSKALSSLVGERIRPYLPALAELGLAGGEVATVEIRMAADGTITSRRLVRSSGRPSWDEAVLQALDRAETLPRDADGRVHSPLVIEFVAQASEAAAARTHTYIIDVDAPGGSYFEGECTQSDADGTVRTFHIGMTRAHKYELQAASISCWVRTLSDDDDVIALNILKDNHLVFRQHANGPRAAVQSPFK